MAGKTAPFSLFTQFDIDLFASGRHCQLYTKFGSHPLHNNGRDGTYFAVYAPAASNVQVIGNFNSWDGSLHELFVKWDGSGIWEGFIEGVGKGEVYKYRIFSNHDNKIREKADPFARKYEVPPKTASIVWEDGYQWNDNSWKNNTLNAPISVYELHLGSWKKEQGYSLSYKALAVELTSYIKEMGFTHVEFMPVMEHPFYPSWGYLCTGFFAPTSRFGEPHELKFLIDELHSAGIGVYLDWVPAHFPADEFALADFDGSALYEHPEYSKGFHPDWNSKIFNFERPQIVSFLLSSAHFWCNEFHADGLRVDAVASMLYLDYSRDEGEWTPNEFGGNEYLAAIELLKELNIVLHNDFPTIQMIAEESTSFTGVTKPVDHGGLGFGLKWMMGWMNDTLEFMERDPIYRKYHHNDISKSLTYAFSENFLLPLSHDEVVHGKKSLIYKMPGDDWQKFANLRLLYTYMFTHPGQKLLFMGGEFAQTSEWNVNESLSWDLLQYEPHKGIQNQVKTLNRIYKKEESLYSKNYTPDGFEWIDFEDHENSVISFIRKGQKEFLVVVLNFSPVVRNNYSIGIPWAEDYSELYNSDAKEFGGSGVENAGKIKPIKNAMHGRKHSLTITLPPLAGIILKAN